MTNVGTSMVVWWLRLWAPNAGAQVHSLLGELRPTCGVVQQKKKKKKSKCQFSFLNFSSNFIMCNSDGAKMGSWLQLENECSVYSDPYNNGEREKTGGWGYFGLKFLNSRFGSNAWHTVSQLMIFSKARFNNEAPISSPCHHTKSVWETCWPNKAD